MTKTQLLRSGELRIPDYTDAELRDVQLQTGNPLSLGHVVHSHPAADEDLEFVAQYETEGQIICAFGHHHKRGFALRNKRGEIFLIGRDCAHTHFGLEWDTFVNSVKLQVDRKRSLSWLHKISEDILSAQGDITAAITHPSVVAFDQLRQGVLKLPDPIRMRLLASASLGQSWLRGDYLERDLRAERLRKEAAREKYDEAVAERAASSKLRQLARDMARANAPVYDRVTKSILRSPAPGLFRQGSRMRPRLESTGRSLLSIAENLGGTQHFGHPKAIAKSIVETSKVFDGILAEIDQAVDMFAPPTLRLLLQWLEAEEFHDVQVEALADGFRFSWRDEITEFRKPPMLTKVPIRLAPRFSEATSVPPEV